MPVTIDADTLATALGVDLPTATRLLAVASAVATNYASAAPDAVLDESVRMIPGWHGLGQEPRLSPKRVGRTVPHLIQHDATEPLAALGGNGLAHPVQDA